MSWWKRDGWVRLTYVLVFCAVVAYLLLFYEHGIDGLFEPKSHQEKA